MMITPSIDITLPPLHANQQLVAKDRSRFKVVCCGRRWGKTLLAMTLCLESALKGKRIWHVAPTYKQTLEGWAYLQRLVQQMPVSIAKTNVSELTVKFTGGGSIQMRTADNPDNLRGSGLDGVVLDEAATMKEDAWKLVLRPALADKQGWALFISTPLHFNWFYDLYAHSEDPEVKDWAAWNFPTWTNPFIAESEIAAAQLDMLPEDFDQEFGASFTAVGGAIFRDLAANRQMFLRPMPASTELRRTGIGEDWGTTDAHHAANVCGGITSSGVVWIRSRWESASGSANDWDDEALRCKRDYGASFSRIDRSQSGHLDIRRAQGFNADKGIADVDGRIGDFIGLIRRKAIFFDINGKGVRDYFNHLCAYHRDKEGKVVEEEDDDVDAGCYLVSELVKPHATYEQPTRSMQLPVRDQRTVIRTGA